MRTENGLGFVILCGVCCVWPLLVGMIGWGIGKGKLYLPGRGFNPQTGKPKLTAAQSTALKGIVPMKPENHQ